MKLRSLFRTIVIILFVFLFGSCVNKQESTERDVKYFKTTEVCEDVTLISFGYDAIVCINTGKNLVIVDAGISQKLTGVYRIIAFNKFDTNNFKYLINTHYHPDHTGGNKVFDECTIIGHENCLSEIKSRYINLEKEKGKLLDISSTYQSQLLEDDRAEEEREEAFCQKYRYYYAYQGMDSYLSDIHFDLTFSDSLHVKSGKYDFYLKYFGNSHTQSDILIHIPQLKILFVGDLFFSGGRISKDSELPNAHQQNIEAIAWLDERMNEIEIVVGGHGQIMGTEDLKSFMKCFTQE